MSSRFRTDQSPARSLGVGDPAPGFRLRMTFEKSVSRDDLVAQAPVLLVFYVFDFGDV